MKLQKQLWKKTHQSVQANQFMFKALCAKNFLYSFQTLESSEVTHTAYFTPLHTQ